MNQMLVYPQGELRIWRFEIGLHIHEKLKQFPNTKKCSERPCQYSTTHQLAVSSTTSSFMMLQCGLCLFRTEPVYITQAYKLRVFSEIPLLPATVTRHPKNHHFLHLLSAWYESSPPIIGSLLPVMVLDILKRSKQS